MPQQDRGGRGVRPSGFTLDLLTPRYERENHKVYLDLLSTGLRDPGVRNVALTGAYGTGKSSVLIELAKTTEHTALNVSLSSMGLDGDRTADEDGGLTNRIQKEIVKQILYTVEPGRAPRSRFGRTARGRKRDGLLLASVVGAVAAAAVTFGRDVVTQVTHGFSNPAAAFLVTFLVTTAIAYLVGRMARGRVSVEQLQAGPASISLSQAPASYFDEYLDEIVYLFEIAGYDLVIFEDIDRFDDTGIFEALRSLNTLLNSAPQLEQRPVRFVYAMRDSLFQKLEDDLREATGGTDADAPEADQASARRPDVARQDVERANRTKFFDLVIPVVPFITRENARDIMTRDFRKDGYGVSDRLLNIVARHVADMRLVTNIRNEFKVFHHHLVAGPHAVPELGPDKLLAIVVYKNVHLEDFEKIRLGTSHLDTLYRFGRDLVTHNVQTRTEQLQAVRAALTNQDAAGYRSENLGRRLLSVLEELGAHVLLRSGNHASRELVCSAEFWRDLAAGGYSDGHLRASRGSLPLTPQLLGRLLNEPLAPERWDPEVRPQLERELATLERAVTQVARASWEDLYRSPSAPAASGETFAAATRRLLGSDLAADLVEHGYLDEYFSLNIAPFYAEQITRKAMNFVQRNVDRGVPDLLYVLDGAEVEAIMNDRPHALEDVGVHNVTVLDHLLTTPGNRADAIVERIPRMGENEAALLQAYVEHGSSPDAFVERLAPHWPKVFTYLAEDANVDLVRLRTMFDAALRCWDERISYELGTSVRTFIEDNYAGLPSLSGPAASARAADLAVKAGATFADLALVGDGALPTVREAGAYPITVSNLVRLTGLTSLSLDRLAARDAVVHAHVLDRLDDYLVATDTAPTVDSPDAFADILDTIEDHDQALVHAVVARANPACVLADLTNAPQRTWQALATHRRFTPSVANVHAYNTNHSVDGPLATLLEAYDEITGEATPDAAMAVVIAVVRASETIPDPVRRVELVSQIDVAEYIPVDDIPHERTNIVSVLLEHDLVEDAEATFAPSALPAPDSFAAAVAASNRFATFMSPALVAGDRVTALMSSDSVDDAIKRAVVAGMGSYLVGAPSDAHVAVARYCLRHGVALDETQLAVLQGTVPERLMVEMLARSSLAGHALVPFLRALGDDYERVSTHGRDKAQLPDDDAHVQIVERLKAARLVSSFSRDSKGRLDVWRHHRPG